MGDNYYAGQIALFPYGFTPKGWAPCNGQLINIRDSEILFALIGTKYGGDGRGKFGLPNMQGLEPIPGISYYICLIGAWPSRE